MKGSIQGVREQIQKSRQRKETKDECTYHISKTISSDCKLSKPVDVKYKGPESNLTLEGTAMTRKEDKWLILLCYNSSFTVNEGDLLDEEKFSTIAVGKALTRAELEHNAQN